MPHVWETTWRDVLIWVESRRRTKEELAIACEEFHLGNLGELEELKERLVHFIKRHDLSSPVDWEIPSETELRETRVVRERDPRGRIREEVHETRTRNGGNNGGHGNHDHGDHDEVHVEHHDRYSDMVTWGLAIAALLGTIAIAVWLWTNPAEKVDLGPVEKKLGDINVAVTNLVTDVTTLSTTIQATNESVAKLQSDLGETNGEVKNLTGRINETNETVSGLDRKIEQTNGRVDTLRGELTERIDRIGSGGNNNGNNGGTGGNGGTGTGTNWTPAQKGEWLRANFPQTTESVQALGARLAGVPKERVRTHLYPVDTVNTVYDGFIILGPNEGFQGEVTLSVPQNGAVDAYPGAKFSGRTKQIGSETVRAFDGQVTGVSMTYWPWLDENPPIGQKTQTDTPKTDDAPKTGSTTPEGPEALAKRMGWKDLGWADQKYGGLRVELSSPGKLPESWEALASGRTIKESDSDRSMVVGVWTIYPPFEHREALGFSK